MKEAFANILYYFKLLKDNCKVYRLMLQLEREHFKEKDKE